MKIFKRILMVLAVLILVVAAIGLLFFPSKIHVERSIAVHQQQEKAFSYVNNLKNWNNWQPWHDQDTAARYSFEGPESGTGATMKWVSAKREVGSGTMAYAESTPSSSIKVDLRFEGQGAAKAEFKFEPLGDSTKVTWALDMDAGMNPLMRMMGSMMDGMVGKDFEKGLNKLKPILEAMPATSIQVEVVPVNSTHYLAVRDTAGMANIGPKLGKDYGLIGEVMKKQNLKMAGAPFAIYYTDGSNDMFIMDASIAVDKAGKASGSVAPGELKEGHAVFAKFFGAYEKVGEAHGAIHQYIGANGMKITGAPWEVYVTDPGMEKDTAKWETDVYYPVE